MLGPRLYDPSTARFSTADSFVAGGLDLGLALDPLTGNRYLFAGANPVAFFDDGHWPRARCWWGTGCRPPASPPAAPPCSENTLDSISIHNGVRPCAEAGSPGEAFRNVLAAGAGALVAIGLVRCFSMRLLEIDYLCGGKARSGAPNTIRAGAGSLDEALSGLASGRSSGVRVVSSVDELDDLFGGLSRGGSQIDSKYPGKLVRLPDGSTVGLRGASRSGGPTIDVRLPDGRTVKVHVDSWPPAG